MRAFLLPAILLVLTPPAHAQELYQWTDDRGRIHWADDPTRIPVEHRPDAVERGFPESKIQSQPVPGSPAPEASPVVAEPTARKVYAVRIEKAGLEIHVPATLNGRRTVAFKVDTGAMINTIPRAVAEDLGLPLGPSARRVGIVGVGGQPMMVPLVELGQIEVAGAVVENVEAAVLDTMNVGLLGMPFFRHFRVEVDPMAGLLTLEAIDLDQVQGLYGGYPESYWRGSFGTVRRELERLAEARVRIPEEYSDFHRRLDDAETFVREEYERLETKASRAGVPRAWRE